MKLPVSQMREGENPYHFESLQDNWLKEMVTEVAKDGIRIKGPVSVDLHVTKLEPDYYLKGRLQLAVEQPCARCAEAFAKPIQHSFDMAFVHVGLGKAVKASQSEESEELDINYFEGNEIDLSPIVKEQVVLSLPYRSLCQENCQGICQQCGKNLNQGPCGCKREDSFHPFSVLKKIKS